MMIRRIGYTALVASLAACASMGTGTTDMPDQETGSAGTTGPSATWPVKTRHHLDLWLHGFAMIQDDTTLVPYFKRGYKADMSAFRRNANVTSQIDANMVTLRNRFAINSGLVNAQFIPLYFDSWDEMQRAVDLFYRAEGNPRGGGNQEGAETIALLAGYFPTEGDREWLRRFTQSLRDENTRFYRAYWDQQQRERGAVVTSVVNLWQNTYRPRLQTFLSNTSQPAGEILLSLPLDGEGRALSAGKQQNAVAVAFPLRPSDAVEAIYVIAHEIVASAVRDAVNDNITPTDRRMGVADRYIAAGAVRAGAMLLQKTSPELVDGYARYYLRSANRTVGTNATTSLAQVFPLPEAIRIAISTQIDVILGGI